MGKVTCPRTLCEQVGVLPQAGIITPDLFVLAYDPIQGCEGGLTIRKIPIENEVLRGAGIPAAAPADPTENKIWFNTLLNQETHWWDSVTASWKPIVSVPDVYRIVQPLVAGNNIITHNLNTAPVNVSVRNTVTGGDIAVNVILETANTVVIFVPVAVASARISIDG
jgi:hypothetical protein